MNWFAEELHKQRITKGISLNEIASVTRISVQFLEALEQGNFEALPQTYIRAFIREYASSVGLNPVEALQRYDLFLGKKLEPISPRKEPERQEVREEPSSWPKMAKTFVIGGIILLVCAIGLYLFFRPSDSVPVQQTAFDDVVKEVERISAPRKQIPGASREIIDSLRLNSHTSDTVWLSIIIDGKRTEEYLFPPGSDYGWIAKEKFSVTLGNAGGISFILNGVPLEPLGRSRAVVRNVIITRENVRQPSDERRTQSR